MLFTFAIGVLTQPHPSCTDSPTQASAAPPDAAGTPGVLQKLGRVLKEKAAGDYERFFKGTQKTRDRLGVSRGWQAITDERG